jgi:hypothetical protein
MSLGLMALGTALGASAASRTKRQLTQLAETPGLDVAAQIRDARSLAPDIARLESERNTVNQGELDRMLEASVPGYRASQTQRSANAASMLRGELPPDVQEAISRSTAGRALEGGFAGSGAGRNLVARDLGRTSLDLMREGDDRFTGILGSTPRAGMANYDIAPQDLMGLRGKERDQKIGLRANAIGAPGATAVWGQGTQQMGKSLMELAGSVAGAAGGAAMCAVAKLCIPEEWEAFYFWKELVAPDWFRVAYNRFAKPVAAVLESFPVAQRAVARGMRAVLRRFCNTVSS